MSSFNALNTQDSGSSIFNFLTVMDALRNCTDEINICGTPCPGTCGTCVQSNADLTAFYTPHVVLDVAEQPVEVQVMAPAGDESQNSALEAARVMDVVEEAQRSGEAFDYEDEYDGDCDCLECRNGQNPELWFDDRQDDGYDNGGCGLDWNEGGYFD
jgi:hypothetical protein